ncbi:MAG TPA: toxin-antitoxin system antitoxin subunit [Actinomycetes bacterium]
MTTAKIAVTLPPELVEAAKRAVDAGRAPSVSAYVAQALARQERADSLAELLDELIDQHGEPSSADYAWARQALGLE